MIFAGDVAKHATPLKRSTDPQHKQTEDKERPSSLSINVEEIAIQRRKRKLLESGDLGYLLDILIQRLHIPKASVPTSIADSAAGDPEAGCDDDPDPNPPSAMDDEAIAIAVHAKSRSLINKMIAREALAAAEPERVTEMIAQLTAVLAIIKELKHLEMQGRWKHKDLVLVDPRALCKLMAKSMFYLFSSAHGLWRTVEDEEIGTEELRSLNVLLCWLAWEIGYDYEEAVPPAWTFEDRGEYDFLLAGNGYLGKLFPRLVGDDLAQSLEMAVERTIDPSPKEKTYADTWLGRNLILGRTLRASVPTVLKNGLSNLRVGGYAYVPDRVEPWTVVLEVDDKLVKLWDFEEDNDGGLRRRGFMRSFVTPFEPSHAIAT